MRLLKIGIGFTLVLAIALAATSSIGQGQGNGGGKPDKPGDKSIPNNLSVPAIFVGNADPAFFEDELKLGFFIGDAVYPEDASLEAPSTGYPVDGYYYVQGTHAWQAESTLGVGGEEVYAAWGDNLKGDARLKTGSPIRVEIGLLNTLPDGTMTGWDVIKLEPNLLDRLAAYGTLALGPPFLSDPMEYTEVRVYDAGATWTITNVTDPANPVTVLPETAASAEVNSTGRIVYGYNLRVPAAGQYLLEFYAPNVTISETDPEAMVVDAHTVVLEINVVPGGGKGGGRTRL